MADDYLLQAALGALQGFEAAYVPHVDAQRKARLNKQQTIDELELAEPYKIAAEERKRETYRQMPNIIIDAEGNPIQTMGGGKVTKLAKPTTATPKPPAGYRYTENNDLEPIPGGPKDQSSGNAALKTTFNLYETARDGLMSGLESSKTGPIVGRIPAFTEGQQVAEGGVAAMAPVLKQLFRVSGEGVFTDRDQALLLEMIPTRKDRPGAAKKKIENIDAIVRAKLGMGDSAGMPAPKSGLGSGLTPEQRRARIAELRAKQNAQ